MKYNSKTTAIPEIIPVVLICTAGIISAARIHLYLALLLHRDYFCPVRMHLYLALLLHRDYFRRPNASLSSSFAPQGLFRPAGCISIFLFCPTGIISAGRMHLYLPLLLHRDYFHRPNASLSSSFAPQGLFPPVGFIPSLLFCSTGIISTGRMHLYLALLLHRDYFRWPNASLSSSFASQGLFPSARCIPAFLFCPTGIISTDQMHLCLPLLSHRDYFHRPDSSLSCSFAPQGLFPAAKCISILLFCYTGIISTGRIHPCYEVTIVKRRL